MSSTRRSKRDVDRFVNQIQQSERTARGYQIALLYCDVKEYAQAKEYLASYISTKGSVPQAHKLMGQIYEGLGDSRQAVMSYRKSYELDKNQKTLAVKICELYTDQDTVDHEVLKSWTDKVEQDSPGNPVLFRAKEKLLMSKMGGNPDDMERFYVDQLVKDSTDVDLHIKLMDLYLSRNKTKDALNHAVEVEKKLSFVKSLSWYEFLLKLFHAFAKNENTATNMNFQKYRLVALCNLIHLQIQQRDIMECVSTLHQFDQYLFEATLIPSSRQTGPQWTAFLNEMQGQYFFLYGLLLLKRAHKNQFSWKDGVLHAAVCFLISNHMPCIDTKNSWYAQMKTEQKFYDHWRLMGCFRLSQGGYIVIPLVEGEKVSRMQELRQLRTPQARDKLYDKMFTLRTMRDKKTTSFLVRSDHFCKSPLHPPGKQSLEEYDRGVFQLYHDNLQQLVWIALNRFTVKDKFQSAYPLEVFDKVKFMTSDLKSGSAESLCQLDIQTFFYATVMCSAQVYEEQQKVMRHDPFRPYILPVYLCSDLCQQGQTDWWNAMIKFMSNTLKQSFAKSRLLLQKGIETVRLIGSHGISVAAIVHLARTFDERVKDLKAGEFDANSRCSKLESLETWAAHYWKEATTLLSRIEKGQKIHLPKERIFMDSQSLELDTNQLPELIEQAKFALATVAMREGKYEEAKELFETLRQPWASYYLSQIYKTLADRIDSEEEDANNQKQALVERALETLYETMDKIQGDKNHALHRILPTDVDDCVNQLEMLRMDDLGASTVSGFENNQDEDETSGEEIYNTPTAAEKASPQRHIYDTSPSHFSMTYSTPASNLASKSGYARPRPSPERLEARIWAMEKKQEVMMDLIQGMKDRFTEMKEEQAELKEIIRQMKTRSESQYLPPPPPPSLVPPPPPPPMHYPTPQQFPGYPQHAPSIPSWGPASYSYPPMSPTPGGGPMSRRGLGRSSQLQQPSDLEEDQYTFGEDVYEDDGSQPPPPPQMYNIPETQLMQDWPFGNRPGLEGKSTITYSPQTQCRMPQPGSFASALRGQAIQYAYNHMAQMPGGQGPNPMPGPGFFSTPKVNNGIPVGQTLQGQGLLPQLSTTQPSILAQVLASKSPVSSTPMSVSMPPNVVAAQNLYSRSDVMPGMPASSALDANAAQKNVFDGLVSGNNQSSIFGLRADASVAPSSGSNVPLFGSLVAASKSPDKKTSLPGNDTTSSGVLGGTPTFTPSTPGTGQGLTQTTMPSFSTPSASTKTATAAEPVSSAASPFAGFSFKLPQTSNTGSSFGGFSGFGAPSSDVAKPASTLQGFGNIPSQSTGSPTKLSPEKQSGGATPSQSPRKRNDSMEEYEPNVDFKPVVELPDLVEAKSGEEEEEALFCQRAKLFRFDEESKQWKERGLGDMKILKRHDTKKIRVLMRRDQVLKLCANHVITKEMKLVQMQGSDKAWCWFANDFSDEELKQEKLAVKFKTSDQAQHFKQVFEDCQADLAPSNEASDSGQVKQEVKEVKSLGKQNSLKELLMSQEEEGPSPVPPKAGTDDKDRDQATDSTKSTEPQKPSLAELFKPKPGTWTCSMCMVPNPPDKNKCLACESLRPGVKPEDIKAEAGQQSAKFSFGMPGGEAPKSSGFVFGSKAGSSSGAFVFGDSAAKSTGAGGFSFGTSGQTQSGSSGSGFKFGSSNQSASSTTPSAGVKFGSPDQSASSTTPSAGVKFASSDQSASSTTPSADVKFGSPDQSASGATPSAGFKFGSSDQSASSTTPSAGVKFGSSDQSASSTTPSAGFKFGSSDQSASSTTPSTGFQFGSPDQSASSTTPSAGFQFGMPKKTEAASATPGTGISFGKPSQSVTTSAGTGAGSGSSNVSFGSGFSFGKPPQSEVSPDKSKQQAEIKDDKKAVVAEADSSSKEDKVKSSDQTEKHVSPAKFTFGSSTSGFQFGAKTDTASSTKDPQSVFSFTPTGKPDKKEEKNTGFQFSLDPKPESTAPASSDKKDSSPFKFTFTPTSSLSAKGNTVTTPKSPETTTEGMYINKEGEDDHIHFEPVVHLPDTVNVKTGEENEVVLFEHRAKLFRFHKEEWRERGLGNIRILENRETGKIRVLMRREQVLKICCNHYITPDLELRPMANTDGKAWLWFALDFADDEQKCEQLSVRFKTADIANNFKAAFDSAKLKVGNRGAVSTGGAAKDSIGKSPVRASQDTASSSSGSSSDVVFVKEEKGTEEQIQRARKFLLPDHFYLYETKEPCSGCIGCEDYEPGKTVSPERKKSPKKDSAPSQSSAGLFSSGASFGTSSSVTGGVFGAASTSSPGGIFGNSVSGGGDGATNGNLFGATSGNFFGGDSSGSGFSFSDLASKSTSGTGAFEKADNQPFSFHNAGQKLFGAAKDDADDDGEVPQSDDPHFEPIFALPDVVEVKTGEEDFQLVFSNRAKLFRYDKDTTQWKEKGIGEMKIQKHKETGRYRLLLRREQVFKLACNHNLTAEMKFQPMATSETSWCWVAQDYSDDEPKMEKLAVKFKTIELAKVFKSRIDECQKDLQDQAASTDRAPVQVTEMQPQMTSDLGNVKSQTEEGEGEEEDDDYEEIEVTLYEKRVTLYTKEKDLWISLGTGILKVLYDDDVNGNKVTMVTDTKQTVCNHLIAKESNIQCNKKTKSCEWTPIDFSTDDAVRRHFKAQFSSEAAAEEFQKHFIQGRSLAVDSEISERDMMYAREIEVPEVHGRAVEYD